MKLNNITLSLFLIGCVLVITIPTGCVADVISKTQSWPAKKACHQCVHIQFGVLDMKIPLSQFGKLIVLPGMETNLSFYSISKLPEKSVSLYTIPPNKFLNLFRNGGLLKGTKIETNDQLLKKLCGPSGGSKGLDIIRHAEKIDKADECIRLSKKNIHAYWIKSSRHDAAAQRIFLVVKGEDVLYMLEGDMSRQFLDDVLSNLEFEKLP